jgi:hypothetical protein
MVAKKFKINSGVHSQSLTCFLLQLFGHRYPFTVCELNNDLQTCLLTFVSENIHLPLLVKIE